MGAQGARKAEVQVEHSSLQVNSRAGVWAPSLVPPWRGHLCLSLQHLWHRPCLKQEAEKAQVTAKLLVLNNTLSDLNQKAALKTKLWKNWMTRWANCVILTPPSAFTKVNKLNIWFCYKTRTFEENLPILFSNTNSFYFLLRIYISYAQTTWIILET